VKRSDLEHIIRAAATIADDDELVIVGSQAVLGQFPSAPPELLVSDEADVYPRNHPERADVIDGSIGEGSPFHDTFGYYAQGVGPETAVLPAGWLSRLIPIRTPATRGATGWCLEVHDLVVSKLIAGREKDWSFATAAVRHRLVDVATLRTRLADVELEPALRAAASGRIDALERSSPPVA
jgi:hypothetical protein